MATSPLLFGRNQKNLFRLEIGETLIWHLIPAEEVGSHERRTIGEITFAEFVLQKFRRSRHV
jgi:hypothetical protein